MAGIGIAKKMYSMANGWKRQNANSTPEIAPDAPTAEYWGASRSASR